MATKSENSDIAVLQTQMQTALEGIGEIKVILSSQDNKYMLRTEFNEFKSRWALSHALVSIISIIFASLATYYFTSGGH
jgi:hypothetical protein